jgi:hypothetical protein
MAVFRSLWSCVLLGLLINMLVSSANIIGMAVGSTVVGTTLIYNKKSKGPKTDPWGTP